MTRYALAAALLVAVSALAQDKPYRLPSTDLKQPVIWGSECIVDDDLGLAFGGLDQDSGSPGTRVRMKGAWERLRGNCPSPYTTEFLTAAAKKTALFNAFLRRSYFSGTPTIDPQNRAVRDAKDLSLLIPSLKTQVHTLGHQGGTRLDEYELAEKLIDAALPAVEKVLSKDSLEATPGWMAELEKSRVLLEKASDLIAIGPSGRALSPIVYDKKSGLFVIFGGDHLDYLTNDTWVFDPKLKHWTLRLPATAPPPRANHELVAKGDGTVVLSGGYTYANNTDYMGGQYVDIGDGEWTYHIARNEWTGGKGVTSLTRTYRSGKFHPDYFLQGPRPDREAHTKVLDALPANEWVSLKPPHLPEMNRDWGTAVLDPDRGLILRWSGGHCAHSGSDVLHYHIATNRWELPFPVEFPLGQCYVNTEFPEGVNFNGRPWVTGHTYQNYGYDPVLKQMVFAGREKDCFLWNPDAADWTGRFSKPKGMSYNSCFYTLTLTPTPQGLVCWTQEGRIFQLDDKKEWQERKLSGEKLIGSVVDNSTIVHDPKRNQLLAVAKSYGDKVAFSGELYAIDCETWKVTRLQPEGREPAAAIPYLCQLRYDAKHDLLLVGGTLPPDDTGLRRTPAYDCGSNRWVSLKITGDDPSGSKGRNVSLGMMYDAKRGLFFGVDTKSNVFALRLDPRQADLRPLQ